MTILQQSKPRISRNSPKRKSSFPRDRLVLYGLLAIGGIIAYVNIRLVMFSTDSNSSSNSNGGLRNGHGNGNVNVAVSSFPELPSQPLPKLLSNNKPVHVADWNAWAATPLVGSYQQSPTSIIHYPYMDLQSVYHQHKPHYDTAALSLSSSSSLSSKKGYGYGYPSAVATAGKSYPNPDCFILTRKGNKYMASGVKSNQDRAAVVSWANTDTNTDTNTDNNNNMGTKDSWMGLLDGHGEYGHVVSHYAIAEFPKRILHDIPPDVTDPQTVKDSLAKIFLDINRSMPNIAGAGSTAISIWRRGDQLFLSNLGDSEAFVVSFDPTTTTTTTTIPMKIQLIYETKPHKPNDPLERKRIVRMGGEVVEPPSPEFSARVLIPMGNELMALAMSRSLGDHEGEPYGVIAEPTTDVIDLTTLDKHLEYIVVVASDGLLDKVPPQEVASHVAQTFLPNSPLLPLEAAEQLILKSSLVWLNDPVGQEYRDDITLAVHRLRL
jgi:serine/threonine protein phosphatase PrpC